LELYSAGVRYRKALGTLITEAAAGRVHPEQVAAFREQGTVSLESADAWLAALSESRAGGLAASLRAMSLPALVDELLAVGAIADQLDAPQNQSELWEHFQVATGMPPTWRASFVTATGPKAEDTLFSSDAWAVDFDRMCRSRGFLPAPELQQRALFEEVVRPLAQQSGPTALFLVDALPFEMGEELIRLLPDTPATTAKLDARLAELPTLTEVGMNVLARVTQGGRLYPTLCGDRFRGFSVGEFHGSRFG
jgi:hypothetical protein